MAQYVPAKPLYAKSIFQTPNTLKGLVEIQVTGGTFPQQKCIILDGIWRMNLTNSEGIAYIPRAGLASLDKVTEAGRKVVFKATFKDGRSIVGETSTQGFAALYAEMATGPKPGDVDAIHYPLKKRMPFLLRAFLFALAMPLVMLIGIVIAGIGDRANLMPTASSSAGTSHAVKEKRHECWAAIDRTATRPDTVELNEITGYEERDFPDGSKVILQTYSAENAMGVQQQFTGRCTFWPDGSMKFAALLGDRVVAESSTPPTQPLPAQSVPAETPEHNATGCCKLMADIALCSQETGYPLMAACKSFGVTQRECLSIADTVPLRQPDCPTVLRHAQGFIK